MPLRRWRTSPPTCARAGSRRARRRTTWPTTSPTPSASMAPTPEPGDRQVIAMPRVRPPLLVVLSLVILGAGVGLFFAFDEDQEWSPPVADDVAAVLARAQPTTNAAEFEALTEVALAVGDDCLRVVVADSEAERGQGLRGHDEGPRPFQGMLFVNESDVTSAYTMSGVTHPLDIGWYDADGEPVDRAELEPCPEGGPDCPLYRAEGPYRFALETSRGERPSGGLGDCTS